MTEGASGNDSFSVLNYWKQETSASCEVLCSLRPLASWVAQKGFKCSFMRKSNIPRTCRIKIHVKK